jgi:hypothetical protein
MIEARSSFARARFASGALGRTTLGSLAAVSLAVACGGSGAADGSTSAGTTGAGGSAASTTAAGVGGASSGAGGSPSGAGATSGTGGAAVGAGGTGAGSGGTGSGSGGTGGGVMSDDFASDVTITVHEDVRTILVVTWTQSMVAEETWLEFTFEEGSVMTSRPAPGEAGPHQDVVLGVPSETAVTVRIVSSQGGTRYVSSDYQGTTGELPAGLPLPDLVAYDAALASPERFMLGSVEDSDGNLPSDYLFNTFWLYIMDRQGRIVWYYADAASNATSSFQRIARDGEYIWIEKRPFGGGGYRGVLKMTLDHEYFEEIPIDGLADCIDVTDDGSLLYDAGEELFERSRDGTTRPIFSCPDHFGQGFNCYTNTINWNPEDETILMSYPEPNTVIQVRREDGEVVGQYGEASGSYAFAPPLSMPPDAWGFGFQHFPNITAAGTLILSSHMPGYEDFNQTPTENQHAFVEFAIDRDNETLTEVWRYTEGTEWARSRGMAIRLENGNTLANYGTGGVIREITADKQTAFEVKFDIEGGNDFYNKLVGHNVLVADLYDLNGGGPN